jgi:hypothetical protein
VSSALSAVREELRLRYLPPGADRFTGKWLPILTGRPFADPVPVEALRGLEVPDEVLAEIAQEVPGGQVAVVDPLFEAYIRLAHGDPGEQLYM